MLLGVAVAGFKGLAHSGEQLRHGFTTARRMVHESARPLVHGWLADLIPGLAFPSAEIHFR